MVMAASKIAVVCDSDQTVASINHRVYPLATNKLSKLKARSFLNHKLKEESSKPVALLNKKLNQLLYREKNLDVLPFTRVSSTCSSGIGNLSLAEIQDQQEQRDIKLKKQRTRQAATKQLNPDPLESNQTKQWRTSITQVKSGKIGKMQELSLTTVDDTCLGNYDPTKDEPVSKNTKSNLETPSWRVIKYSGRRSVKDTEIMSDRIFEKRHHKHEQKEQICKRRDLRQLRELIRVENLKQGRNKHQIQDQQEQRDIKLKKRRTRQAATKQPNPDPLESNQTKQRRKGGKPLVEVGVHILGNTLEVLGSTRKSVEVRGSTWKYLEVLGSTWKYSEVRGSTRKYVEVLGNMWKYAEVPILNNYYLTLFGVIKTASKERMSILFNLKVNLTRNGVLQLPCSHNNNIM